MAGKAIKGITIEVGGDTTKLDKALKEPESKAKSLQAELKKVNAALKLDPKNTELLAQKQKLLAEAVETTKEKLDTLKEAEKQVAEQAKNGGEVSEEAQRELQREIVFTEAELKKLEDAAKDGNTALQKAADAAHNIGDKAENLGKKLLPVSGAIAGIAAASVVAFNDVDNGYDTIITKTGATGEALEGLQENMDNLFSELPIEAEEAGIAVGEVNTRFGETGEVLEELSADFLRFSKINGTDLNNSIGMTDKLMEQFGVTSENTAGVLGLMTSKGQETGVSLDTLMNNAQRSGSILKEMGLGLEESIVLLAQMEANGVNSEQALMGMRKAIASYTAEGKTAQEGLQLTIESIKNATSETEAMAIAQEVFGARGATEMANAIKEERFSVEDLSVSFADYKDVVQETYEATLDPPEQAKVALNNLKLAGADLAASIFKVLQPAFDKGVQLVKDLTKWFGGLSDKTKENIVRFGGLAAAAGPALIVFGKLSKGVGDGINAFQGIAGKITDVTAKMKGATSATGGLSGAMGSLFSPAGWVVLGVAAAAAIGVAIYRHVTAPTREATESMKGMAEGMVQFNADMESAESRLTSYSGAFADMNAAQDGARESIANAQTAITEILRRAVDDRNSITDEDIQNLQNYYAQIEAENARIVEIERNKMDAIVEIEAAQAQNHQGSLAEYQTYAMEAVATAKEQADATNAILEQQSITEIASLTQKYESLIGTEAEMSAQQFEAEKTAIIQRFNEQQRLTSDGIGQVSAMYADGYARRMNQDTEFTAQVDAYHARMKEAEDKYTADLAEAQAVRSTNENDYMRLRDQAQRDYNNAVTTSWNTLTRETSEEQQAQIANMLQFAIETEMYGGQLDATTQKQVNDMINSWSALPQKSKDTMLNTMQPMLETVRAKAPELYDQLAATGEGALGAFQNAVGVESPSWKTKAIMGDVMAGAELGLENKRESLLGKAKNIANAVIETLNKAFDRKSPAGVTIAMFEDVGQGAIVGLDNMADKITATAGGIGESAIAALQKPFETNLTARLASSVTMVDPRMVSVISGTNATAPLPPTIAAAQSGTGGGQGGITQINKFEGCDMASATENARKIRNETRNLLMTARGY